MNSPTTTCCPNNRLWPTSYFRAPAAPSQKSSLASLGYSAQEESLNDPGRNQAFGIGRAEETLEALGAILSERAWGTVREDYSPDGTAWEYLPHDHARSRAYRWNEDGLAGICDRHQTICFALALWNGHDPILKERLFGLTGNEGNHGEDVKEYYFYLDSTPTHSYMKYLYKYPQAEFPYAQLVEENQRRGTQPARVRAARYGIFDDDRYFDVFVEYAKADSEDILIRITVINRGPEAAIFACCPHCGSATPGRGEARDRRAVLHQSRTAPNPVDRAES